MKNWKRVPGDTDKGKKIQGLDIKLYIPPSDFPSAYRGGYDEKISKFVIEFHYSEVEESKVTQGGDDPVLFIVGEATGRLYAIHADMDRLETAQVTLAIRNRLHQETEKDEKDSLNFKMAENLFYKEDKPTQELDELVA